jgi:hypothetical protein
LISKSLKDTRHNIANTLVAIGVVVAKNFVNKGLSSEVLKQFAANAKVRNFDNLIVPVRPALKSKHPEVLMEEYLGWRKDEEHYDPWIRVHQRLGAKILGIAPNTLTVQGAIEDWKRWTNCVYTPGELFAPEGALSPVEFSDKSNIGIYKDPNVWMKHII